MFVPYINICNLNDDVIALVNAFENGRWIEFDFNVWTWLFLLKKESNKLPEISEIRIFIAIFFEFSICGIAPSKNIGFGKWQKLNKRLLSFSDI